MSKKILITGTAGFIFSNVVIYLVQHTDYEIVGIDKLTYAGNPLNAPEIPKRFRFRLGDVCDADFVNKVFEIEKPDIVVHACAESHVDNSIAGAGVFASTNVVGTQNMLSAALRVHTPEKFINVSTDEVYKEVPGMATEETPLEPRNPYSATKAGADMLGQAFYKTYGLPIITTRCCNNFGPRQDVSKFIPKVIYNTLHNKKIPLYGTGENIREWLYVKDHFWALMDIIERGEPGQSYNISANIGKTNKEVLQTIFNVMGTGEGLVEHVEDRLGHDFRYSIDASKLRGLGWNPIYTDFEEAIGHTIDWYIKNHTWFWK